MSQLILISDTHSVIGALKQKCFSDPQAEAFVRTINEIDMSALVTKNDLKSELTDQKFELIKWSVGLMLANVFATAGLIITLVPHLV